MQIVSISDVKAPVIVSPPPRSCQRAIIIPPFLHANARTCARVRREKRERFGNPRDSRPDSTAGVQGVKCARSPFYEDRSAVICGVLFPGDYALTRPPERIHASVPSRMYVRTNARAAARGERTRSCILHGRAARVSRVASFHSRYSTFFPHV